MADREAAKNRARAAACDRASWACWQAASPGRRIPARQPAPAGHAAAATGGRAARVHPREIARRHRRYRLDGNGLDRADRRRITRRRW